MSYLADRNVLVRDIEEKKLALEEKNLEVRKMKAQNSSQHNQLMSNQMNMMMQMQKSFLEDLKK